MGDVTKTPRSIQDLIDHATYLYLALPASDVSENFLLSSESAFHQLAQMPGMGAPYVVWSPRLPGLRKWPIPNFRNHLIFYRETQTGIEVVRVLHASRDLRRVLLEEDELG